MMTMRCSTAQTISRLQRLVKKEEEEEEEEGKAMDERTDERRTIQRGYAPLRFVNRRWKSAPAAAAAAPSSAEMMSAAKD